MYRFNSVVFNEKFASVIEFLVQFYKLCVVKVVHGLHLLSNSSITIFSSLVLLHPMNIQLGRVGSRVGPLYAARIAVYACGRIYSCFVEMMLVSVIGLVIVPVTVAATNDLLLKLPCIYVVIYLLFMLFILNKMFLFVL